MTQLEPYRWLDSTAISGNKPAATRNDRRHAQYESLIRACRALPPIRTAVVHPCDQSSLEAAMAAAIGKLIEPVLVGPEGRIRELAARLHFDLTNVQVVNTPHSHAAAEQAVTLARSGTVGALMKGSLHTDELMSEVVRRDTGIRSARRISHVFVMDVPTYPKPLFITDAAVNLFPTLEDKVDIVQNAIDLTHALGMKLPKVAILSAVETITSKIPSTIDAAALCKMADRGQITGATLDGPLALDNAINREAAAVKNIESDVAGDADILLVPNLEAGNMLVKELTFLANADAAGIVLGAKVPIILTSRADSVRARLASCAVAALFVRHRYVEPLIPTQPQQEHTDQRDLHQLNTGVSE
jgi:phosphate acetyltransferase